MADDDMIVPMPNSSNPHQHVGELQEPVRLTWKQLAKVSLHWRCLTVSALLFLCIIIMIWCRIPKSNVFVTSTEPCRNGLIWIPASICLVFYVLYIIECMHCHIHRDLIGTVSVHDAYRLFRMWSKAKPLIKWKAVGYHYGRTVRHYYTDANTSGQQAAPQLYYMRINSHTCEGSYHPMQCSASDQSSHLHNLEQHSIIKVDIEKYFSFGCPCSEAAYLAQRKAFYDENVPADDYIEMHETFHLSGMDVPDTLCITLSSTGLPWYCQKYMFWVFSILCLSWPLRMLIETNTAYASLFIHKRYGARCCGDLSNGLSLSSIDSKLSDNAYGIIPSYSEALLMSSYTINGSKMHSTYPVEDTELTDASTTAVCHHRTLKHSNTINFPNGSTKRPQRTGRSKSIQLILSHSYQEHGDTRQNDGTKNCIQLLPSCQTRCNTKMSKSSSCSTVPPKLPTSQQIRKSKTCDEKLRLL